MKWVKWRKLFELYMSPGGVTELIHFFIAEYSDNQRANAGGGVEDEDIEVLELPFSQALEMIKTARYVTVRRCYCLTICKRHI
ncbi:NUDIX-family hydrolase [Escherichia coli]|uniref:NUDIX-family hydrolase n=1 Tax=Escherichia coli TaxID=562 RepID=A0A2X1N8Q5_ECOLX|nr:NUDIX-family hydrolase [Escherichia coli]